MLHEGSLIEVAGRLMIVLYFLVTGIPDLGRDQIRHHVGRIAESHVPFPAAAFWIGIAMKFAGCALLIAGWRADIGIYLLMLFVVAATAIYLRFWSVEDPMRRNVNRRLFASNIAVLGALLLLLDTLN